MFTYLHAYMPETWDAQVKAGFINKNSGIRFCQNIALDEEKKFNNLAREGGTFYSIVKENGFPVYIDRLQGGTFFEGYNYDFGLVEKYKDMLGDKFLGFQMHEWMSNFLSDTSKVRQVNPKVWDEKNITEVIFREFPFKYLYLEAVSAAEMAEFGNISEISDYLSAMQKLFKRRMDFTGGLLIPADSAALALNLEIKQGIKRFMPEVGAQIPNMRLQMAYSRGMSKAYGIPFGIYYEPWGGEPFSAVNYQRDSLNEWNLSNDEFPFKTAGGNGGSSRSLQKRIHHYAYLSGAQFISEEWGMANTFYDWHDFEITPYGKVKLEFIRFTEKYPDIGEIITPVAIALPASVPYIETAFHFQRGQNSLNFSLTEADGAKKDAIYDVLDSLLCADSGKIGSESELHTLMNYITPDAIDIVHEDRAGNYDYYVNLTGKDEFAKTHTCVSADEVDGLLRKVLPVDVRGKIHYFVNRTKNGYYLTLMNNTGVYRSVKDGEILAKEADSTVEIDIKSLSSLTKLEGDGDIYYDNGKYYAHVPAGTYMFIKLI